MFVKGMRVVILTLAACGATVFNPAAAGVPDDVPSVTVRYSDLNLNATDGVAALYRRLRLAAADVCDPLEGLDVLREQRFDQCSGNALADAVAKVNNAALTAYYAQMTHGATQPVSIAKN